MGNKVLSNQRVTVLAGLANSIANYGLPTLAELTALTNVSGAVNWDSFDLNIKDSDQKDDRTLTDGAGSQSRSPYTNFGGNVQFVHPTVLDTSSIYKTAYNLFGTPRVELVVALRYGKSNASAPAAGDKWTVMHVIVDPVSFGKNDVSRFYQITLVARDDIVVHQITPPASAVAITTTQTLATGTASAGTLIFAKALYQGWDITKSATWVSSDETKLTMIHPGVFKCIGVGTPTLKAQYKGATDSTPATITVS